MTYFEAGQAGSAAKRRFHRLLEAPCQRGRRFAAMSGAVADEEVEAAQFAVSFTAYDVAVELESLAAWHLGEEGTGYAVQLNGPVDDRWARCYHLLRVGSPSHARFHLDREKKIVWFACREGDRPTRIRPVLDVLCRLVESVNETAESEAWDQWGER